MFYNGISFSDKNKKRPLGIAEEEFDDFYEDDESAEAMNEVLNVHTKSAKSTTKSTKR